MTWYKSPANFCVMQKSLKGDFRELMTALQKEYKEKEPVAAPSVGQVVVARYSDGAVYRAEIVIKKDAKYGEFLIFILFLCHC